jgi:hypothetical protein
VDDLKKSALKSAAKSAKSNLTDSNNNQTNTTQNAIRNPKVSERIINTYNISPGMAYEEWAKTRDQFLSKHNMATKID